ncbi:MAG: DUF3352 domain-containing protein [Oscillochloris sp.]|nr:DUF3352 domain-containing protein [Oscillochloris sp.]
MELPPVNALPSDTPTGGGNRRTLLLLIGVGVVALLLIGAGAVALAGQLFGSRSNSIPQLIAGETQIYAAITPNLSDLPHIERLRKAFPEVADYQNDSDLNQQLSEKLGVTFKDDIAPWIGTEMAVAVSGIPFEDLMDTQALADGETPDVTQSQVIFVLSARDQKAAQAFLDKQRQHREGQGEQFTSSQADGATIYAQQGGELSPITAFGLVRNYVVFATSSDLISAIATRDPDGTETLAANTRFQQVLAALSADRIGFVYLNGEPIAKAITANADQLVAQIPEATANQFREQIKSMDALQGMGLSISMLADGLAFDALGVIDQAKLTQASQDQLKEAANPVSADRVGNVSANALSALSFRLPSTFGQQIRESIDGTPGAAEQVAQMEQELNLDLDRDLLSWLQGEVTIVLLPGEEIMGSPAPVTGYLALTPNDRAAAEDGMSRIIKAAETGSGGMFTFSEEQIADVPWQVFSPEGQAIGGYAFVGDDLVIGFGHTALEQATKPTGALSTNSDYQTGTKVLPSPNGGLFFVNLPAVVDLVDQQGGLEDLSVKERLAPFKAITAGASPGINEKGVSFGRLFLVIAPE